jgi:FG-GAP-like repeat
MVTAHFGTPQLVEVPNDPSAVAVADLNQDSVPDLVAAGGDSDDVSVFVGNGKGNFSSMLNFGVGVNPSDIAVGDFDGDGKSDLAVATSGFGGIAGYVTILTNTTP